MDRMLDAGAIAERYGVTRRKAREMMLDMPCINVGTEARKILHISERKLTQWEDARSQVREKETPVRESRRKSRPIRINEYMNPDGTCKRRRG